MFLHAHFPGDDLGAHNSLRPGFSGSLFQQQHQRLQGTDAACNSGASLHLGSPETRVGDGLSHDLPTCAVETAVSRSVAESPGRRDTNISLEPCNELSPRIRPGSVATPACTVADVATQALPGTPDVGDTAPNLVRLRQALAAAHARIAELEEREERRDFYLLASMSPDSPTAAGPANTLPDCPPAGAAGRPNSGIAALEHAADAECMPDLVGQTEDVGALMAQVAALQKEIKRRAQVGAECERQAEALQVQLVGVREELQGEQHRAAALWERCSAQEDELAVLRAEASVAQCAAAESESALAAAQAGLRAAEQDAAARREEVEVARGDVEALCAEVQGLRGELEARTHERNEAATAVEASEKGCQVLREQRGGAVRAAARLQEELEEVERKCEGLRAERERALGAAAAAERQRDATVARLEQAERDGAAAAAAVRAECEAAEAEAAAARCERDAAAADYATARRERDAAAAATAAVQCRLDAALASAALAQQDQSAAVDDEAAARQQRDAALDDAAAARKELSAAADDAAAARGERDAAVADAAAARRALDAAHDCTAAVRRELASAVSDAAAARGEREEAVAAAAAVKVEVASAQEGQLKLVRQQREADLQVELASVCGEADSLRQVRREHLSAVRTEAGQIKATVLASVACQVDPAPGTDTSSQTEACAVSLSAECTRAAEQAGEGTAAGVGSEMSHRSPVAALASRTAGMPLGCDGLLSVGVDGDDTCAAAVSASEAEGLRQDAARARCALVAHMHEASQLRAAAHQAQARPATAAACQNEVAATVDGFAQTGTASHVAVGVQAAAVCRGESCQAGLDAVLEADVETARERQLRDEVGELQRRCRELAAAGALRQEFYTGLAAVREEMKGLAEQLVQSQAAERARAREAEELRQAGADAAGAATERHAALEREAARLRQRVHELEAAAVRDGRAIQGLREDLAGMQERCMLHQAEVARDGREMLGLKEDLAAVQERYELLKAAEAREAEAADDLRLRLAESQGLVVAAEVAAAEKARAAWEAQETVGELRRELAQYRRFQQTCGCVARIACSLTCQGNCRADCSCCSRRLSVQGIGFLHV